MTSHATKPGVRAVRLAMKCITGGFVLALATGMAMFVVDLYVVEASDTYGRLMAQALLTAGWLVFMYGAAIFLHLQRAVVCTWIMVLISSGALIAWSVFIWHEHRLWEMEETNIIVAMILTFCSFAALHTCLFILLRSTSLVLTLIKWFVVAMGWTAVLAGSTVGIHELVETLTGTGWWSWSFIEGMIVVALVGFMLWLFGTLFAPFAIRIHRLRCRGMESLNAGLALEFNCPQCKAPNRLPPGHRRCVVCKTRFVLEFDEPRCACGYLLYRITGDSCPECGRGIEPSSRWTDPAHQPPESRTPRIDAT